MTDGGPDLGGVSNEISGGVFFNAVVMGRDIKVVLPAEVRPALTGLPPASTVFAGRDSAVQTLREALQPHRKAGTMLVSAVAGMAGVGKTELVLHTAHQVLRDGWFPGGVLFVDMFGYDPDRRLSAADALLGWLAAIGLPGEHIPAGGQDRSRLWRSVLDAYTAQGRRLLLIIDNAASEDQVIPLLPGDDRIPVLVTSRHTLDLDASLYDLDVLDASGAVALLREVIASRRGPDDPRLQADGKAPMAGLAELCAGLPLALRIVAALLADRPHLQPTTLADRLRDEQHRLDGLTRQQAAVRTAFDLSYQHLTYAQARMFRLLPVNPGPDIATLSAAHLAGLAEHQAAMLLADLHRAHLIVEPAPERWGMHDLLRLYATEQRASDNSEKETETEQARQRLCSYYQYTVRAADTHLGPTASPDTDVFADRAQAMAWLDAEHANLIATATATINDHLPNTVLDLATTLARFLGFRRHFTDWITISVRARDLCQQSGDLHGEGWAWNNLGRALREMRRFDEAIEAHTRARDIFQQTGHIPSEGAAWSGLGRALREVRRFDEAIDAHTKDLEICQQFGDLHGEGAAWLNLGGVLQDVRRFDDAIEAHTRARDIFQRTGDLHGEGAAWSGLGRALVEVRRFDKAIEAHTKDLEICQQFGDLHGEGMAWNNLGGVLQDVRRFDDAIEAQIRARDIFQRTGDLHREGWAWQNLGTALYRMRRFDEAIQAYAKDLDICQRTGDLHGEGWAWGNFGIVLREVRRFEEAIEAQSRARDIFQRTGDLHREGKAWGNLGTALYQVRRFDEARGSWQRAITALTSVGDKPSAEMIRRWLNDLPTEDLANSTHPQSPQLQAGPDAARAQEAPPPVHAALDISHPVFQLELGMDNAAVVRLLGEEYLSMGRYWLYSDTPAGCDIQLVFRFGALASVEVKTKAAHSTMTVLMAMDRDRIVAAPPYQAFVEREMQRRTRRSVEKIVVLHSDDELSPKELQVVVSYVEVKLGVKASGVLPRAMPYDVMPENITRSFGMAVLANLVSKGEIAYHPANPAWVGEVSIKGNPCVIIVSYKKDV